MTRYVQIGSLKLEIGERPAPTKAETPKPRKRRKPKAVPSFEAETIEPSEDA